MRPGTGTYPEAKTGGGGGGMITFAAVLLGVVGFFNLLNGIAAIANSRVFANNALYVVGDLHAWGWVMTILGGLQLIAAVGVGARNQAARWFAIVVVSMNAVGQMFFIPAYPFWSLMVIVVDIVALYALSVYGGKEHAMR
jgi:hypothetical protein